jgi:uncharacterized protein (DUF2267 family)
MENSMSEKGLEIIERNVHLIHSWIDDIDYQLNWGDHHKSFRLLRAWLHALRDSIPLSEVAHVSAQLPLIVRGLFFEQWRAVADHHRMDGEEFLRRLDGDVYPDQIEDTARAAASVFLVFKSRVGEHETDKLLHVLPRSVRELLSP